MEEEKNVKDAGHTLNVEDSTEDNNVGWFSTFYVH